MIGLNCSKSVFHIGGNMSKKIIFVQILCFIVLSMTACVDFEAALNSEEAALEEKGEVLKASLGDINDDGRNELIVAEGSVIKLLSETKVLAEFEPNSGLQYDILSATAVDIDQDKINEIMVYASIISEGNQAVLASIYLLDSTEEGKYIIRDFPEELSNIDGNIGVDAQIIPKPDYQYEIICHERTMLIDVSRIYSLSKLNQKDRQELDEKWEEIVSKNRLGEVRGITSAQVLVDSDSNMKVLRIYELLMGSDRKSLGHLVVDIAFEENGKYNVVNVSFMERTDVQP